MQNRNLYLSGWNPKGVRKDFERCSVGLKSAQDFLGDFVEGEKVKDVCAWFGPNGDLKIMVADTDKPRRIVYRRTSKGFNIQFSAIPQAA